MADGAKLGPTVEVHCLDNQSVTLPMTAGISEPGRRPILSVWHGFGIDGLEHRALFEQERDVLIVLDDLHRMRRERSNPTERHATAGIVTLSQLVIIVPLRLTPGRERKRIRLAFVAGAVRVRERASHILSARTIPHAAQIGFPIRKTGRWRLQIRL